MTLLLSLGSTACPGASVLDTQVHLPQGFEVELENVIYHRQGLRGISAEAHTAHALLAPTSGVTRFERAEFSLKADPDFGDHVDVVAGAGSANLYSGRVMLRRGVRVRDGTGRELDAPSAAYSPEDRSVAGPGPATLTGHNYLLRADTGFFLDLELGSVDLLGPVTGFADELPPMQ